MRMLSKWLRAGLMAFACLGAGAATAANTVPGAPKTADDLLDPDVAFHFSARLKDPATIEIHYDIAPGYYMYRDNFRFTVEGAQAGVAQIPHGKKKFDVNFQKTVETHRGSLTILLPFKGAGPVTLKAISQGCADLGVCYPPATHTITFAPGAASSGAEHATGAAGSAKAAAAAPASDVRFTRIGSSAQLDTVLIAAHRPAMLDFYADWCGPCKQMQRTTFADPRVKQKLAALNLLQADVTRNNGDDKALLARFKLVGPPGIMFFDKDGREITALRVIGYKPPEEFLRTLDKAML
jgi:thiol:disulfide interchange protein